MAKFKNQDILFDDNEQVILGSSNDAAIYWDTSDLIVTKHPKHITEGYYATKDYVKGVVAGLEWQDSVISATTDIPGSPNYGDRYIVPSGASGAWSGLDDDVAEYTTSWSYVTPSAGFSTWVEDTSAWYVYTGSNWVNFGGKIDHGNLKGLTDDDHSAYPLVTNFEASRATIATNWTDLTDAGDTTLHKHDTMYYTETELDGGQLDNRYYTEAETDTLTQTASANAADVAMDYTDSEFTTHTGAADPHTGYLLVDGSRDMSGDLLPAASDTYDLGHSDAVWDNIWCKTLHTSAGSLHVGSVEITDTAGVLTTTADVSFGGLTASTLTVNTSAGVTGWFDDGVEFRVQVANGLITSIGPSVTGGYYEGT